MSHAPTLHQLAGADQFLDAEQQHDTFDALGKKCFVVFREDSQGDNRVSTQVRNLQQVTVSARRLADVEDFVKNQMGKNTRSSQDWRKVGEELLEHLRLLRKMADELAPDDGQRLQLRLYLARGWVRAVVAGYLFARAEKEVGLNHA